jgi:hypothetical protein
MHAHISKAEHQSTDACLSPQLINVLLADSAQLSGWATGKLALASLGGFQTLGSHIRLHTLSHIRTHTLSQRTHAHTLTRTHTRIYAHTHAHQIHPHAHAPKHTHEHTHILTHTHPGTYTEIRTCTSNARTYFQSRTSKHRRLSQPSAY